MNGGNGMKVLVLGGAGYIGSHTWYFSSSREALQEARKYYTKVDGCFYCCPESHIR